MLACAEVSTRWPRPVVPRARYARSVPIAAYIPAQNGDCGSVVRTGGLPGSPASDSAPLAAVTSRSDAGAEASGPSDPYGVTDVWMSRSFQDARRSAPMPSRSSSPGGSDSTRTSAVSTSRRSTSCPPGWARSRVTPRLLAFSASHQKPRSGPGRSATKGGRARAPSPAGGSTFTTSAPRSARIRPHCALQPSASSMTRMPASGSALPTGRSSGPEGRLARLLSPAAR